MELISLPREVYNFTNILSGNQLEGHTFFLTYPETNENKMEKESVNTFLTKNDIFISIIFDPIYSNNFKSKHLIRLIKHRITTFNELTKALFIFNEQEIYKDKSFEELEKYILNENKKGNFDTIIID